MAGASDGRASFGKGVDLAPGFAEGVWQHALVTFDGDGVQPGVYWNGRKQSSMSTAIPLVPLPFGPITFASLSFSSALDVRWRSLSTT